MALLDVMVSVLANQALNYLVSGVTPQRLGNRHPNIVPYQSFAVKDGHIMIAVGNDAQFRRLCEVLELPKLAIDPRYVTNPARVRDRVTLSAELSAALITWSRDGLLRRLEDVGVPAGPINTVSDAFHDPQVVFRGLRVDLAAPQYAGGSLPSVRSPIRFSAAEFALATPSPRLGEHTAEVKGELQ
jgi:crotonobetainyl-CoA:carnitine CoA-transferase CaiB-like acyl-CoA transferase